MHARPSLRQHTSRSACLTTAWQRPLSTLSTCSHAPLLSTTTSLQSHPCSRPLPTAQSTTWRKARPQGCVPKPTANPTWGGCSACSSARLSAYSTTMRWQARLMHARPKLRPSCSTSRTPSSRTTVSGRSGTSKDQAASTVGCSTKWGRLRMQAQWLRTTGWTLHRICF